ncbi:helix-turn-helix domain-containing protein [uncultured Aquabacterium sp.]|uniref:helix-turn-helix domain-containing protein n=1 Tax=Aquabacterium sp. TaxID=1872578 RepID=UPI0025EEEED7|nr:helix-turn-helix domain-containing protein [uncultured Aquabacterium sp.]
MAPYFDSDDAPLDDAPHAETAAALAALLGRHGIPARHQAAQVAQICAISVSQARRKLKGAVWLFDEVRAVCQHVGARLDDLFPSAVARGAADHAPLAPNPAPVGKPAPHPARLHIDGRVLPCQVQLGPVLPTAVPPPLEAVHAEGQWHVGTEATLAALAPGLPRYAVDHLTVVPCREPERPRVAVVDDDPDAADALSDWLCEAGWRAQAYTRTTELMAPGALQHDAYVIDLILAGGQTSQALVERIRADRPQVPIVLLTGQLREGPAPEATLATLLRTQDVVFFEKPVRPTVLMAAIQRHLDRLRHGGDATARHA